MKRRREGTLQRVELTPADGVAWVEALAKITNGGTHTLEGILDAAARLANDELRAHHPGGRLLCGYEVRVLHSGKWEEIDD